MISSSSLIGCEIFVGDSICIRPKADYLLLKSSHNITNAVVLFAGGSHCEVFELECKNNTQITYPFVYFEINISVLSLLFA